MGHLLFASVIALGVGYAYPLWNEHASSPCQAMERRFIVMASPPAQEALALRPGRAIELAVLREVLEPVSNGALAAAEMKQRYPALPPAIGCTVAYWSSLLDRRVGQPAGEETP